MSSSLARRERRMQLQIEKKLFKQQKLRIPTPQEVEEYIKEKVEYLNIQNKINEINKSVENV